MAAKPSPSSASQLRERVPQERLLQPGATPPSLPVPVTTQVLTYTYDLAGNRTSLGVDGVVSQTLSYNAANQVVGWTYDAVGNLTNDGTMR